ncbi:hypothetical protein [Arthrobacter livingstonensis]|nr:hypothetical protein [Arthrobacter livingstonensis]
MPTDATQSLSVAGTLYRSCQGLMASCRNQRRTVDAARGQLGGQLRA